MKKSPLYTGGGDNGMTALVGGHRVPKTDQRLEAYGTIDELNSFIGLLITETEDAIVLDLLRYVQHQLFAVGAYIATDQVYIISRTPHPLITPATIIRIERGIDLLDSELPKTMGFILPGGCRSAALAHVCRTVCRRAERQLYRLRNEVQIDDPVSVFINRLSDLLFVIARRECFLKKGEEIIWDNTCK